jgi:TPR repeat protein
MRIVAILLLALPLAARADTSAGARGPCQGLAACEQRCTSGEAAACYSAALYYEGGDGVPTDGAAAQRLFQSACTHNDADGCARVAELMEINEAKVDPSTIAAVYRKACDDGSGRACGDLGYLHRKGNGVPLDEKKGFALAARGHKIAEGRCKKGHALSCEYLGLEHALGTGGYTLDLAAGQQFLEKACALDGTYGCDRLAMMYEGQMGHPPDPKKAKEYNRKACAAGSPDACARAAGTK